MLRSAKQVAKILGMNHRTFNSHRAQCKMPQGLQDPASSVPRYEYDVPGIIACMIAKEISEWRSEKGTRMISSKKIRDNAIFDHIDLVLKKLPVKDLPYVSVTVFKNGHFTVCKGIIKHLTLRGFKSQDYKVIKIKPFFLEAGLNRTESET